MNNLYITNDIDNVRQYSKQYAEKYLLEWYEFENNKESIEQIMYIYNNMDNVVIFLVGLTKSVISNKLLKTLEENNKNIHIFVVSSTYDVSEPLQARFTVMTLDGCCLTDEINEFIKTRKAKKEVYGQLSFYIQLAWRNIHNKPNLDVLNYIINEARKCTYNTPWEYYFLLLKEKYK